MASAVSASRLIRASSQSSDSDMDPFLFRRRPRDSIARGVDHFEPLTHYRHLQVRLPADPLALSGEESPVSSPPVAESLVAFAFDSGKAVTDAVERDDLDVSRFDDAHWGAVPIGYHAEVAHLGKGLVGELVGPQKTRGGAFLAGQNKSSKGIRSRLVVVEVERLVEQWRSVIGDCGLKLV